MFQLSEYARNTLIATYWYDRAYGDQPVSMDYDHLPGNRKLFANRGRWYDVLAHRCSQTQAETDQYSITYATWKRMGKSLSALIRIVGGL